MRNDAQSTHAAVVSPKALDAMSQAVVRLIADRDLEGARALLALLCETGRAPSPLLVAYAVCLAELGEPERAAEILALVDRAGQSGLLDAAAPFLPGGPQSRARREAFQAEAERWLPRASKSKKGGRS